jgi:2-polyprenyl-3-methyl-5-hydroxy-6-metoxy-1,4-benzoquinol methylase
MAIDETKLQELTGKIVGDVIGTFTGPLVVIGDRLGLYKAISEAGPITSADLAKRTGTRERYIREWAFAQAAAGYIEYDPKSGCYSMTPEQTATLADDNSPAFFPGAFEVALAAARDEPKITEAYKSGRGVGWHEHDPILFRGTERFFRAGYATHLVSAWIPALEGVKEKLERGAEVADVGCGHGASTILMAKAFPNSHLVGFDYHQGSIDRAREAAKEGEVADHVRFEKAASKEYPGKYDLVAFFDCLHDMGDPVGAATHVRETLKPDGTWMVVEPFANDNPEDNFNPVGRMFFAASAMVCVPASLSQEVGLGLGTQAGEKKLIDVIKQGGFTKVRTATTTPFNRVLEAKV